MPYVIYATLLQWNAEGQIVGRVGAVIFYNTGRQSKNLYVAALCPALVIIVEVLLSSLLLRWSSDLEHRTRTAAAVWVRIPSGARFFLN